MKKLQSRIESFGNSQVLTREQLKNVMGGGSPTTGQSCTMAYKDASGKWQTEPGTCTTIVTPGRVTTVTNYCKTEHFEGPVPLSSNGGVSKCGATQVIV